jgi:hypothetical protein
MPLATELRNHMVILIGGFKVKIFLIHIHALLSLSLVSMAEKEEGKVCCCFGLFMERVC